MVNKAVIPAAGWGTRFLPATKAVPKPLLPVVDTPMIQLVVDEARAAGIAEVCIVIGPRDEAIRRHFAPDAELEAVVEATPDRLERIRAIAADVTFVIQDEPRGLADAVLRARAFVGSDPFAVLLPDELFGGPDLLRSMLDVHARFGAPVVAVMRMPADEIGHYGAVDPVPVDERVVRMADFVEKPPPGTAPSDLGSVGRYLLDPTVLDAADRTAPGAGGEIQLTDAIAAVARGAEAYAYVYDGPRWDVGRPEGLVRAARDEVARRGGQRNA